MNTYLELQAILDTQKKATSGDPALATLCSDLEASIALEKTQYLRDTSTSPALFARSRISPVVRARFETLQAKVNALYKGRA